MHVFLRNFLIGLPALALAPADGRICAPSPAHTARQLAQREQIAAELERSLAELEAPLAALSAKAVDALSAEERARLSELTLARAELHLRRAAVVANAPAALELARADFERLRISSRAGSPLEVRARLGLADVALAGGFALGAAELYRAALDEALPLDAQRWSELARGIDAGEKQSRFVLVELGLPGLLRALTELGDSAQAAAWSVHFVDVWQRAGVELTPTLGDRAVLAVARVLIRAGGWIGAETMAGAQRWCATREELADAQPRPALDLALELATTIADRNPGNALSREAHSLVADIAERPQSRVAARSLLEAALAEIDAGGWSTALERLRAAWTRLETSDAATRAELGARVLGLIGDCELALGRELDAAASFERALVEFPGDAAHEQRHARALVEILGALRQRVASDPALDARVEKAELLAVQAGGPFGEERKFLRGMRLFDAGEHRRARAELAAVGPEAESYELARVQVAVCELELDHLEAALLLLSEILPHLQREPEQLDPRRTARRAEALASAVFHLGECAWRRARAGAGAWEEVLRWHADYRRVHPQQESFAAAAECRVIEAELALGNFAHASELLDAAAARSATSPWTTRAAKLVYENLAAARASTADEPTRAGLLRGMARALEVLEDSAATPSFDNLRLLSQHWIELGEWSRARARLERLRELFAGSPEPELARAIEAWVLPDLAEVLLAELRVREAAELSRALVESGLASERTRLTHARALAGWTEVAANGEIVRVPGIGTPESFDAAGRILDGLARAAEPWTGRWYAVESALVHALDAWGELDGARRELARQRIAYLERELGPRFEHDSVPRELRPVLAFLARRLAR